MNTENIKVPFPGWSVVREIGHGGYGTVYEIRRHLLDVDERSAMKVIPVPRDPGEIRDYLNDGYDRDSIKKRYENSRNAVLREYTMMARMKDSVNIVRCEDITVVMNPDGISSRIFIRMELLTPIREYEKLRFYDENEIIRLGMDICSILCACEREKIVHRDIKPANIMVSARGDYKLGDFGIARMMDHTTRGTRIGTVNYMAPEVYFGGRYGHTADIYSLGLVLYWLMNNRRIPFLQPGDKGSNINDELEAQQKRLGGLPIPRPCFGSARLVDVVLRALAFNPYDRFRTAEEFRRALYLCMTGSGEETIVEPVPGGDRRTVIGGQHTNLPKKTSAHGKIFPFLAGMAAILVTVGLIFYISDPVKRPADSPGNSLGKTGDSAAAAASEEAGTPATATEKPAVADSTAVTGTPAVTETPAATEPSAAEPAPETVQTQYGLIEYGSDLLPVRNEVNIRSEPTHDSNLLLTFDPVPHGSSSGLIFKGQTAEGYGSDDILHTWYLVGTTKGGEVVGWVRSDLVRLPAYDNGPWHIYYDGRENSVKVCVPLDPQGGLNVRRESKYESELVDTVYAGTRLFFYDEIGQGYGSDGLLHDWYRVEWAVPGTTEERAGWVRSDLVTVQYE